MGLCRNLLNMGKVALFILVAFEFLEGARSLRQGGKNVLTKYETYYVKVTTSRKQMFNRQTCRRTCRFWIFFCSTKCRTVSYYRWVNAYRNQAKTRPVHECKPGWRASGDECTIPICTNPCQNNGTCTAPNTCNCTAGWTGSQCAKDINECNSSSGFHHGCEHMCVNFAGGYNCTCAKGHFLASNGKNCTDHDECAGNIHGCDQGCVNYPGGYNCTCKSGYRLNTTDFKSCDDLNECAEKISGCAQNCKNLAGSFNCFCNQGYYLGTDGKSCYDVNECSSGIDGCEHNCVNTQGSYGCTCRPGFDLSPDGRHCMGRPCVRVKTPVNGNMNCTGNTTEHVCYFMCSPGYELTGSKNRTCSAERVWTGIETACKIIHCPVPVAPRNGFVYSPCNTKYTSECIVGCLRGFYIEGINKITCDSDGVWKPRNTTCKEIRACQPNPCQNGGKCLAISASRFTCNCSLTGYAGSKCDVGKIDTPLFPTLTSGVPSSSLQFQSSPASDYVILTPRSPSVVFDPPFLLFNTTSSKQSMTVSAQQRGLHFVEYSLSGPDAADFEPPQNDVVFVEKTENTTSQTPGNARQPLRLPIGCHQLEINKCPATNYIVLSSTSSWRTLGPMLSTSGVVTMKAGKTTLPLSLLGSTAHSETPPTVEEQCAGRQGSYSIEELLRSRILTKSFLEAVQTSLPSWLLFSLPQDVMSETVVPSDLKTYFMSGDKLRTTELGKGQPLPDKTSFSLLISRNINLTIENDSDILGSRDNKSPFSLAVDLCSTVPKNVMMRPSAEDVNLVNSISLHKRLKENGWDFTIYSLQISKTKSIERLAKGFYWNGERFIRIDSSTKGNLAIVVSLRKSFLNQDFGNCFINFNGTVVISVDDVDQILHSPFEQQWLVDLYGNSEITMKFEVEGKKTDVALKIPQSISYATFGGSRRESTSMKENNPQGLYISHTLEECPFLRSELSNFIECGSNRTLSAVFRTELQSNKKSNQPESGDKIGGVSMAFRGNLKFGPLRFDDMDIMLEIQNTELSDTSSSFSENTFIEINGNRRNTVVKKFGIFNTPPSKPQMYVSRKQNGSSMGSFQSVVSFLGFENQVNVSFSRSGLAFNTKGKVHGLYDASIRFYSSLTSWESQTFLAVGEFDNKSDSLVEALDKALYTYGVGVFNRATRRVTSFNLRVERAHTRLENMIEFAKTKRQEMDKASEDYLTAKRKLEAAKAEFKNIEGRVSGLKNLTSQLNNLCPMKQCGDVCRKGMVCRKCNYEIAGKSKDTCLGTCFKTERRIITSNVSSVLCKVQNCTRVYLKSGLSKLNLRNTLSSITKEVFSYAMKPSDFSLNELPSAVIDVKSSFFPGNTNKAVCKPTRGNFLGKLKSPVSLNPFQDSATTGSQSYKPCGKDGRDGHWDCRVRLQACEKSDTKFQYEYYQKPYPCERPCEEHVTNGTIPTSCCSTVPCAFSIIDLSCAVENALCSKRRSNIQGNSSFEKLLKNLESARINVSYWDIMKRKAAIRLSSASNALNVSENTVRNLGKAHNITVQSKKDISKILAQPLRLKEVLNERRESFKFIKIQSVKFNVTLAAKDESTLLPVRVMFKLNESQKEMPSVLNFRDLNTSLRDIVKDIMSIYLRESTGKVRRKRSTGNTNSSFAEQTNSLNETNYLTVSTLQKYHKLCSEFTNYEQVLYDVVLSFYNLTSEVKRLVQEANLTNVSGPFNTTSIVENFVGNETSKSANLKSLETDPVLLVALDLQNEAIKDGFEPLNLTSQLLFRSWYSTMESIFNVVLRNCSGFDDCVAYVLDGLAEMHEVTDLPGARQVQQHIKSVRTKLSNLIQSVDISIDDAVNSSSNILKILQDMSKMKLFCARSPNITKNPEPLTEMGVAQTLVLACNATGDSLLYKWRFNENLLEDQTNSILLIRNTTPSDSGNYTCEVSNHISKETSTPALVIIHPPPFIKLQPVDHLSLVLSVNDSLECVAENSASNISYQWWFKSLDSTSFLPLTNEIFSRLNFVPIEARHEGWYFCNVSNSFGYSISNTSFVKALHFTLPVPVATLSLSLTRKSRGNATFLRTIPYARIQSEISALLLLANGNTSDVSKPQIRDLRVANCRLVKAPNNRARDIAEICQWKFDYVGKNATVNSSVNDMFQANAQKVINSTRDVKSAVSRLVKVTNNGGLTFDAVYERYILEPQSLGVETFSLICSPGQKLIQDDFRCVDCPPGFYGGLNAGGMASCLPCAVGSHLNESGQTSCVKCPEGFTTASEGSFHESHCEVICPAGHFGKITQNIGQCLKCPVNTYQSKKGQFGCIKCPSGRVTTTNGAEDISRCILEPTGGYTTEIQTSKATEPSETTVSGVTIGPQSVVDDGTDMAPLISGVAVGVIFLIGFLALLILLLAKKRRNAKGSYRTDQQHMVISRGTVELKDWRENPAFSEDGDFTDHGDDAENPSFKSSRVTISPSNEGGWENPTYESDPKQDCEPIDEETHADATVSDDNIDSIPKESISYDTKGVTSSFGNPLYDTVIPCSEGDGKDNKPGT